jgi:hypothetical protein
MDSLEQNGQKIRARSVKPAGTVCMLDGDGRLSWQFGSRFSVCFGGLFFLSSTIQKKIDIAFNNNSHNNNSFAT